MALAAAGDLKRRDKPWSRDWGVAAPTAHTPSPSAPAQARSLSHGRVPLAQAILHPWASSPLLRPASPRDVRRGLHTHPCPATCYPSEARKTGPALGPRAPHPPASCFGSERWSHLAPPLLSSPVGAWRTHPGVGRRHLRAPALSSLVLVRTTWLGGPRPPPPCIPVHLGPVWFWTAGQGVWAPGFPAWAPCIALPQLHPGLAGPANYKAMF